MSQTGSYISSLVWETSDSEGPTRAEYQTNWNAMDGHLHDNRGAGRGIRAIQTATAPAAAGDVQLTGDSLKWWGASSAAVMTSLPSASPSITGTATFTQASPATSNIVLSNSSDSNGRISVSGAQDITFLPGTGKAVKIWSNTNSDNMATFTEAGGLQVGAPTGGDKGAGTVNATAVYVNGTALSASAGKKLGSGTATTNQAITSTVSPGTDVTGLTVTCTPDGTHDVKVAVSIPDATATGTNQSFFALQKDGVIVDTFVNAVFNTQIPVSFTYLDSAPTNASHVYKVSAWSGGAQTINTVKDAVTVQNLILVEQLG